VLDNTRCISFLTIELHDRIPRSMRRHMGLWIFGCDDCQEVCPVNRKALPARIASLRAYDDDSAFPRLTPLLDMDAAAFRTRFGGTPVTRAKLSGMQRNVCVALGNARDPATISVLRDALLQEARHPLVREHAAWALGQFDDSAARDALDSAWGQRSTLHAELVQEIGLGLDRAL
jgi:epoxyqueuosine reductase